MRSVLGGFFTGFASIFKHGGSAVEASDKEPHFDQDSEGVFLGLGFGEAGFGLGAGRGRFYGWETNILLGRLL
jgi:hypothetical protein